MMSDEEIIAQLGDELPLGVWIARAPGGEFVYANKKFRQIMGMDGLDDVARGGYAQPYGIHRRDGSIYPETEMPFVRALQAGHTVMVDDIVIHRHDGDLVYVRAYARPVREEDVITHVVIAFFDISREVEAEQARIESEEQLHATERLNSLGRLAGGVAHDVNNMLGTIRLIAGSLASTSDDEDAQEQLGIIDDVVCSAADLARALLTFAGRGKNRSAPVYFREVVESVRKIAEPTFGTKHVMRYEDRSTRFLIGDRPRIEQLVLNLVINARDAMPEGGAITVRSFDHGDDFVVEVEDEGPGIPAEFRSRVFDPFFTTKNERRASTGLGLATVFGIVSSHDGKISIEEGAKGGACFHITLPSTDVEPDAPRRPSQLFSGSGRVLVIDDEEALREATLIVLDELGYEARAAADGQSALDLLRNEGPFDAAILDMTMPGLTSTETFLGLREIQAELPVLLTTGYAHNDEAQRIIELGVNGFIEKPWSIEELSEALRAVLTTG